jgi:predicted PurR-regulated permease PerM
MAAGFAAFIFSIFPMIGPHALYLVVGAVLILQGNWITGIVVLAYGLPLSLLLDYLVRPYLAGKVSTIHPLIILLGIFGGASSMGFAGLILGPITLSITIAFIKGYLKGKNAIKE